MFLCTQKRPLHLPSVGYLHQLGDLASDARGLARGARICVQRTPRRAHNPIEVIVCYNLCFAELRVRGLPQMVLWYICTFGHWHICTLAHLYLPFSPIVVQMGDAAIDALSSPSYIPLSYKWGTHCRTNGGCYHRCTFQPFLHPIIVQMGDATIDALSSPSCTPLSYRWGTHCRTNGGCIGVQMGDALSYRWGMLP